MVKFPKKAMLLGIDAAIPELIEKFAKEGKLPHIAKLMEKGVFGKGLPALPTLTSTNWTTIVTGAWPGTHGITCMSLHFPGEPLDGTRGGNAFDSRNCQAEFLWQAAEKVGKKSILVKYPGTWPPSAKNLIQVAGHGHNSWGQDIHEICPSHLFSTEKYALATQIEWKEASGWTNLPQSDLKPLEATISLQPKREFFFPAAGYHSTWDEYIRSLEVGFGGEKVTFHLLLLGANNTGYKKIAISKTKNYNNKFTELSVGQWSPWIEAVFKVQDKAVPGSVQFKLLELSPEGSKFRLFSNQVFPTKGGFTYPNELAAELTEKVGPFISHIGHNERMLKWVDDQTVIELYEYQNNWFAKAARYLLTKYEWDLYFLQSHCLDYAEHAWLLGFDPISKRDPQEQRRCEEFLTKSYQIIDKMIGETLEMADDDTLILVISDHGSVAGDRYKYVKSISQVLEEAGLLAYKMDRATGRRVVDWSKTKAFPNRSVYIYVNLKGREPLGIVEAGKEYGEVRDRIINALYGHRDPDTGKPIVTVALRKEDARILGLYGDRVGDVIYALADVYTHEHGQQLPTTEYGLCSMVGVLVMAGPGIKKNYILPKPFWLVDIAPTIAYLLGIPTPRDSEGRILMEAFEVPDPRLQEREDLIRERDGYKAALGWDQQVQTHHY